MQNQETTAAGRRAIALVELGDGVDRDVQQLGVAVESFLVGVQAVGEQGEGEVAPGAGQMMHFDSLDLLQQVGFIGQQRRHRDQGAHRLRYTSGEVQAR